MRWFFLGAFVLTGCFSEPDADECAPGEFECMCTNAGECLGELECRGNVCLDPLGDATDSMTTSVPTTSNTSTSTSSTTMPPSSSSTSDDTGSSSTGGSSSDGSTAGTADASSAETVQADCDLCLLGAIIGECPECTTDNGCQQIHDCIFMKASDYGSCCVAYPTGIEAWNTYVACAMATELCMGQCDWTCDP